MNETTEIRIHAHVNTESRDCDSTYGNSYVMTYNDEELAETAAAQGINDFSEINFRNRVLTHIVSVYTGVNGTLKVTGDPERGLTERLTWNESTEEGYRAADALFCTDDCDTGRESCSDSTAEAMGY